MQSVTTKTGDTGNTGLADGRRLPKTDPLFEVLGTLDELNSHIGFCITQLETAGVKEMLFSIQHLLFTIGAVIAGAKNVNVDRQDVMKLEQEIDRVQQTLKESWHAQFVLPGGSTSAATLDIARAVCRRLERVVLSYAQVQKVDQQLCIYLNRLSDYLYVLRCSENGRQHTREQYFSGKQ